MKNCKICGHNRIKKKFEYFRKPSNEKKYTSINYKKYNRLYFKCQLCGHFSGFLKMSIGKLYDSEYNNTVYSGEIKKNFNKIKRIPPFKSDNFFRVTRIDNFIKKK